MILPEETFADIGDQKSLALTSTSGLNVAHIRTSDRISFKRCRRKWNWSSNLREYLQSSTAKDPLWIGTGFHYAMEDFHGLKQWPSAADAFEGYYEALKRTGKIPGDATNDENLAMARHIINYYEQYWLTHREPMQTYYVDGRPQCEVKFEIILPFTQAELDYFGYDQVKYSGTFDRIAIDEYGRIWIVEYKTAKAFQNAHLETDSQVSAYCWAARCLYNQPVAGVIYQQHRKVIAHEPVFVSKTKMFSVAKNQVTTVALYRKALINLYGSYAAAPLPNKLYLDELKETESGDQDKFVRRDFIDRNLAQIEAEGSAIMDEVRDMLDPNLRIYKNPTRDCSWDCDFRQACINMDDGGDWEYEIESSTLPREEQTESWRNHLKLPGNQSNEFAGV